MPFDLLQDVAHNLFLLLALRCFARMNYIHGSSVRARVRDTLDWDVLCLVLWATNSCSDMHDKVPQLAMGDWYAVALDRQQYIKGAFRSQWVYYYLGRLLSSLLRGGFF